jgi:uncharacterized protein
MLRELLMLADSAPNVFADTSGIGAWGKYLDGHPAEAPTLRHTIDVMGAERLLFGTDSSWFPRGWRRDAFDAHLRVFDEIKLDKTQVAAILGGNLERLLTP